MWETVSAKADSEVPGWVREGDGKVGGGVVENGNGNGGVAMAGGLGGLGRKFGPGMVVNLSGVRPVGVGGG